MEARETQVDGLTMRSIEHGDGDVPVVLIHGIPTSPELWRRVLPLLHGVRAHAWEMVGYGASIPEGRDRPIGIADQAEYLRAWMDARGIDRAVLVGHDLGGGVAQILAARHPERCAGLVLMNCVGLGFWPIPSVRLIRRAGGLVGHLPSAIAHRLFRALIRGKHDDAAVADESAEVHWRNYAATDGAAALVRQARSLDDRDTLAIADDLPRLAGVPATVLWGTGDRSLPVDGAERLARGLGAKLERIEGARHFVPEDHPDVVARAIDDVARAAA